MSNQELNSSAVKCLIQITPYFSPCVAEKRERTGEKKENKENGEIDFMVSVGRNKQYRAAGGGVQRGCGGHAIRRGKQDSDLEVYIQIE